MLARHCGLDRGAVGGMHSAGTAAYSNTYLHSYTLTSNNSPSDSYAHTDV